MKESQKTLEGQTIEDCSRYLKAVADPIRLKIVQSLRYGSLTVSDLALALDLEMANISHHLRVLFNAGMVTTERDGKFIYYSLNEKLLRRRASKNRLDFGCCRLDFPVERTSSR
jgi:DNA-binding transcriptional ArsR family regulator